MKRYISDFWVDPKTYLTKKLKKQIVKDTIFQCPKITKYDRHGNFIESSSNLVKRVYNEKKDLVKSYFYGRGGLEAKIEKSYDKNSRIKEYRNVTMPESENELYHAKYDTYGNEVYVHQVVPEDQADTYKEYTEYYYDESTRKMTEKEAKYNCDKIAKRKRYEQGPEGDKLVSKGEYEYGKARKEDKKYREERFYFEALRRLIKENVIKNKEEKNKILKELKTKLKWFIGTGEDYSEEKIKLQRLKVCKFHVERRSGGIYK